MVETLHQTDQGVFVHMMELLRGHLGKTKLKIVEERMSKLQKHFWIGGLTLPSGSYWVDFMNVAGHEHRSVMQVSTFFCMVRQIY